MLRDLLFVTILLSGYYIFDQNDLLNRDEAFLVTGVVGVFVMSLIKRFSRNAHTEKDSVLNKAPSLLLVLILLLYVFALKFPELLVTVIPRTLALAVGSMIFLVLATGCLIYNWRRTRASSEASKGSGGSEDHA